MQQKIHPKWYPEAVVTCSCGNTFTTGSTKPEIKVDICSACHPFFTGEMKFVDVQGRVEKFRAKWQQAQSYRASVKAKKQKTQKPQEVRSLKDMLQGADGAPVASPATVQKK
jgi:large subunit ribosomal protein L31